LVVSNFISESDYIGIRLLPSTRFSGMRVSRIAAWDADEKLSERNPAIR
jgi:hypothetical protein